MLKQLILKDFFAFNGEHTINLKPGVNILLGINGSGKTSLINSLMMLYEGVCGIGMSEYIRQCGSYNAIVNALGEAKPDCFSITYVFDAIMLKKKFPKSPFTDDVYYKITVFPVGNGSGYTLCESLYTRNKKHLNSTFSYLEFRNGVGSILKMSEDGEVFKEERKEYAERYGAGVLSPQELVLRQITDPQAYLPSYIIREAVASMALYAKFNIDKVRELSDAGNGIRLSRNGDNIAYLYNRLHNNSTLVYNKICKELNTINPNYKDLGYTFFGNRLYLHLVERNLSHTIDLLHISDGTIKFMLLMGILYNPEGGYLCAIDEPESYLHPDMIRSVAKMMKDASKRTQLIVATHSPLLLNDFKLSDILVFQKNGSNQTEVKRGDEAYTGDNAADALPGQLWLNGEIGGTRW